MPTKKFLFNIDLNKNQIINGVLQNLAAHPSSPVAGLVYYNTTDKTPLIYSGTEWVDLGGDIKGFQNSGPVTISVTNGVATISVAKATTIADGLLSKEDKVILNNLNADTGLGDHTARVDNPHMVDKADVGLGNASNTSDDNKPVSTAQQTALDLKSNTDHGHGQLHDHANAVELAKVTDGDHDVRSDNPHSVNKADVGLSVAENTTDAAKPISTATQAALDNKSDDNHGHGELHAHANATELALVTDGDHDVRTDNPHGVSKTQVGLSAVNNTSDAAKPVSTATQAALDDKADITFVEGLVDQSLKTPEAYAGSANTYPTTYDGSAIKKGDTFRITSNGVLGDNAVNSEDLLIALTDAPGQTNANWMVAESNRDQATEQTKGVMLIASDVQAVNGSDNTQAMTPMKVKHHLTENGYSKKKVFEIEGNGINTQFTLFHEFGTTHVQVTVMSVGLNPYPVEVYWVATSSNNVAVTFDVAPPSLTNYSVSIIG